jgi:hypothetical protein
MEKNPQESCVYLFFGPKNKFLSNRNYQPRPWPQLPPPQPQPLQLPLPHCCCCIAIACCIAVTIAALLPSAGSLHHTSAVLFAAIFLHFDC